MTVVVAVKSVVHHVAVLGELIVDVISGWIGGELAGRILKRRRRRTSAQRRAAWKVGQ